MDKFQLEEVTYEITGGYRPGFKIIDKTIEIEDEEMEDGSIAYLHGVSEDDAESIVAALEKQVPKKITGVELGESIRIGNKIVREGCKLYRCKCGSPVSRVNKYCSECGQRLELD